MIARWVSWVREWWEQNWLRFHAVMTPIGSGLVTLWLSQAANVGWLWNSQEDFEAAAKFASAGILFYTGAFAILEMGVWQIMVLALKALESYEKRKEQRREQLLQELLLQTLEALEGKVSEDVLEQIIQAGTVNLTDEARGQFMERWREARRS